MIAIVAAVYFTIWRLGLNDSVSFTTWYAMEQWSGYQRIVNSNLNLISMDLANVIPNGPTPHDETI